MSMKMDISITIDMERDNSTLLLSQIELHVDHKIINRNKIKKIE
jgi:hypothetical protein